MTIFMPTSKKRLYVTLPKEVEEALYSLAQRDETPASSKAVELIQLALEIFEDETLSKIALLRDTPETKYIEHENAWQ